MPIAAVSIAVANLWAVGSMGSGGGGGGLPGEFRVYRVTKSVLLPQRKEVKTRIQATN